MPTAWGLTRSLVAFFHLTQDPLLLDELKRHLDSPDALLSLSQAFGVPDSEKLKYAKLYLETKPDAMEGYLLAASIARRCGEPEEAVLDMVKKGMAETFTLGSDFVSSDMRDALKSSGMGSANSEIHLILNDHHAASLLLVGTQVLEGASRDAEPDVILFEKAGRSFLRGQDSTLNLKRESRPSAGQGAYARRSLPSLKQDAPPCDRPCPLGHGCASRG